MTVEKDLQLPLNQILIFNFYVVGAVGYNACRHIVWGHYVLGDEEEKKESVHEDESRSAATMLPFYMAGLEVGGGGGEGHWDYEAASCPLCPIVARMARQRH